jgi:hypothetical protein
LAVSLPESWFIAVAVCLPIAMGSSAAAGQQDDLRLEGRVLEGDIPAEGGVVVLHSVSPDSAGEVDSVRVAADGSFELVLPGIPDAEVRSQIYFASIQYEGVLYFGTAITQAEQLDSLYTIQVFGSEEVPRQGLQLPITARNLFLELSTDGWWIATDMIAIENVGQKTLVAAEDGIVWSYPLPPGAESAIMGQGELPPDAVSFEGGRISVSAPIPPGERTILIRYNLPELEATIPVPGLTGRFELFVKEPAPPFEVAGLEPIDMVSLEAGSSYRRYGASALLDLQIALTQIQEDRPPPFRTLALLVTAVLAGAVVLAYRRPRRAVTQGGNSFQAREGLILEVAKIDQALSSVTDPHEERHMREQRMALMSRLRGGR